MNTGSLPVVGTSMHIEKLSQSKSVEQWAEVFNVMTEVWCKRTAACQPKVIMLDGTGEFPCNPSTAPLIAQIRQEAAIVTIEELKLLRVRLAKAFLNAFNDKLAGERTAQRSFQTPTIFD